MYSLKGKLLRSQEQFKKLQITPPALTKRNQESATTERRYDNNTLILKVTCNYLQQEETIRVKIHKSYLIKDIKIEALKKFEQIFNSKSKKLEGRLLKASTLLNDEDGIEKTKLEDQDNLLLVLTPEEIHDSSDAQESSISDKDSNNKNIEKSDIYSGKNPISTSKSSAKAYKKWL